MSGAKKTPAATGAGNETERVTKKYTTPFESCQRFARCAVNRCPLHPDYLKLKDHPADRERHCKAPKADRVAIAAEFPGVLPTNGLLPRERPRGGRHGK